MADDYSSQSLHEALVSHGLILPSGVPGVVGRGAVFEDVLQRFNDLVTRTAKDDGAEVMHFPPTIERRLIEKSGYLKSFPHLAGTVFCFCGSDVQHRELLEHVQEGKPWGAFQTMSDVALTPSVCYPLYQHLAGQLPAGGRLVDLLGWVFRHEPSPEPTRLQSFRMREFVRAGTPDQVIEWRNRWHERGHALLLGLGLPATSETAADPFFGRGGKMLAANQREQKLKFEVVVPVISSDKPTAVCSFNYHQDHFGQTYGIRTADGEIAHSACLGFGMERVTMALFRHHGFVPAQWPRQVRDQLWP